MHLRPRNRNVGIIGRDSNRTRNIPPFTLIGPSNLAAVIVNDTTIDLSWTDNDTFEDGFSVEQDGVEIATPAANATTLRVTGLTVGISYAFRARSIYRGGYSPYSSTVNVIPIYEYGWPTKGVSQSNVAAQWLFNEASGNITDTVTSLVLTKQGSGQTYSVASPDTNHADLATGITFGASGYYKNASNQVQLNIGTNHAVLEFWLIVPSTVTATGFIFDFSDGADTRGYYLAYQKAIDQVQLAFFGEDGSTLLANFTSFIVLNDDLLHKWRIVIDRADAATIYIDGVQRGTTSISGAAAKVWNCYTPTLGASVAGGAKIKGTLYEARFTIGNKTNNSGG